MSKCPIVCILVLRLISLFAFIPFAFIPDQSWSEKIVEWSDGNSALTVVLCVQQTPLRGSEIQVFLTWSLKISVRWMTRLSQSSKSQFNFSARKVGEEHLKWLLISPHPRASLTWTRWRFPVGAVVAEDEFKFTRVSATHLWKHNFHLVRSVPSLPPTLTFYGPLPRRLIRYQFGHLRILVTSTRHVQYSTFST